MSTRQNTDVWADGEAYEAFMGQWSRAAGEQFIRWLALPTGLRWLDVGCGTAALSETVLRLTEPESVLGVDRSASYVAHAREHVSNRRARFDTAEAEALPADPSTFDVAVSGLVLNFVADPVAMLREAARVVRPGGTVAVYVWDYADGMEMLRRFWDVAVSLDPRAADLDEGSRFPICRPGALSRAFEQAGLQQIEVTPLDVRMPFPGFDAYWAPFLGGQGPAPGYVRALGDAARERLHTRLRAELSPRDEPFELRARAWAARGVPAA